MRKADKSAPNSCAKEEIVLSILVGRITTDAFTREERAGLEERVFSATHHANNKKPPNQGDFFIFSVVTL
jgi:hypothetical protein